MKQYVYQVTINEGSDDFWDTLIDKPGIEEVTQSVTDAISDYFDFDNSCAVELLYYSK